MKSSEDAFGHALHDHLHGLGGVEIIERSDGHIDVSAGAEAYFSGPDGWSAHTLAALEQVHGRVLDVGCGAGRFALYLQERGHEVVAIDVSPLAVEVCRARGVRDARVLSISQVRPALGMFDTILMLGNNFGLFGSRPGARRLLRRFARITTPEARIIAETLDPYQTREPFHLEYQQANRERGRMGGQIRIRVRYKRYRTPWFDYLFVSRAELKEILHGTGWRLGSLIESGGPNYVAVLQKDREHEDRLRLKHFLGVKWLEEAVHIGEDDAQQAGDQGDGEREG